MLSCVVFSGCQLDVMHNSVDNDSENVIETTSASGTTTDVPGDGNVDIIIGKIVNNDGGIINIHYTVRDDISGEDLEGDIYFDPNGGESPNGATFSLDKDKKFFNLSCPFVRESYVFLGWSLEKTGDPYIQKSNDNFAAYPIADIIALAKANDYDGDLTFYAIWGQNTVITYDANIPDSATEKVKGMPDTAVWEYGKTIVLGQAPSLINYMFDGWFFDADGTDKAGNAGEILPSNNRIKGGNVCLYAKWIEYDDSSKFSVTIVYDANKPEKASNSIIGMPMPAQNPAVYDQSNVILAAAPSLLGWTFEGWYLDYTCTNKVGNAGSIWVADRNGTYYLYAKWTENSYQITYSGNKPANATSSVMNMPTTNAICKYDNNVTLPAEPNLTGYRFTGWYTDSSAQLKVGNAYQTINKPNFASEGIVSLYAGWEPASYRVSLCSDGVIYDSFEVNYNCEYGYLPDITKDGNTFIGWYTQLDGGTKVESYTVVKTAQNHTLYARWLANTVSYDVYHQSVNGTFLGHTYVSAKYGDTISVSPIDVFGYDKPESKNIICNAVDKSIYFIYTPKVINISECDEKDGVIVPKISGYEYLETRINEETGAVGYLFTKTDDNSIAVFDCLNYDTYKSFGEWSEWIPEHTELESSDTLEVATVYGYFYFECPNCGQHSRYWDRNCSGCQAYISSGDFRIHWITTPGSTGTSVNDPEYGLMWFWYDQGYGSPREGYRSRNVYYNFQLLAK